MTITPLGHSALWQPIEDWQHRACVISLTNSMFEQGYKPRSVRSALRVTGAFIEWRNERDKTAPKQLAYSDITCFIAQLAAAGTLRNGYRAALERLRAELLQAGALCHPPAVSDPHSDIEALYEAELRRRGYADQTIASHLWFSRRFLRAVWVDEEGIFQLTHQAVRNYLAGHFDRQSSATSKVMSSRLRTFLRFCWTAHLTEKDLAPAIPAVRNLRLAALPSFMSADQLGRVLKACDRTTTAGRRDFAVLMLLSRLGLRASEVAFLTLDDIDWRAGLLRVKGKGGRITTMPLSQDVGSAISDYIMGGRPVSGSRAIFHRVETPCTPFRSATPVILIARRALQRAKISGTRSRHAHIFRHSFATIALRSGASLTELAQVLRHKDPDTTRIYAKVDIEALRSLSRPWAGEVL